MAIYYLCLKNPDQAMMINQLSSEVQIQGTKSDEHIFYKIKKLHIYGWWRRYCEIKTTQGDTVDLGKGDDKYITGGSDLEDRQMKAMISFESKI